MIAVEAPAQLFVALSKSNPKFAFASQGGAYLLLAFLPGDAAAREAMLATLNAHQALFADDRLRVFGVLREQGLFSQARDRPGQRWFLDESGEIGRRYGAVDEDGAAQGRWVLIDPSLRVMTWAYGPAEDERFFAALAALPAPEGHAGVELCAPVLVAPRIFEPALCRRLIDLYEADGGPGRPVVGLQSCSELTMPPPHDGETIAENPPVVRLWDTTGRRRTGAVRQTPRTPRRPLCRRGGRR